MSRKAGPQRGHKALSASSTICLRSGSRPLAQRNLGSNGLSEYYETDSHRTRHLVPHRGRAPLQRRFVGPARKSTTTAEEEEWLSWIEKHLEEADPDEPQSVCCLGQNRPALTCGRTCWHGICIGGESSASRNTTICEHYAPPRDWACEQPCRLFPLAHRSKRTKVFPERSCAPGLVSPSRTRSCAIQL